MTKTILKFSSVLALSLLLSGCILDGFKKQPPAPIEPVQPQPQTQPQPPLQPVPVQPKPIETVPQPPKIQTLNWSASVEPLVAQMVQADDVVAGSILLVDNVKNSTNGNLQTAKATAALQNALSQSNRFTLITPQQLAVAKQTLGLSAEDSLVSRSKAVGLARYVGAQYVLYSNADGDVKSPELQMQLMLVQSGEIIWSGNGSVQH